MQLTGSIRADVAGTYRFFLKSDDGSKLFINRALVINNDGRHVTKEVSASVALSKGWNRIE